MKPKNTCYVQLGSDIHFSWFPTTLKDEGQSIAIGFVKFTHCEGERVFYLELLLLRKISSSPGWPKVDFKKSNFSIDLLEEHLCEKCGLEVIGRNDGILTFQAVVGKKRFTEKAVEVIKLLRDLIGLIPTEEQLRDMRIYQVPYVEDPVGRKTKLSTYLLVTHGLLAIP